jgi:serine/threonine-protein kinase
VDSDVEVARARLGRTVGGRFRLERVLGTGGMGAVYAARAPDGSVVAVKILHPEMGARREVRARFLREGSAANKIGHPGVVQMLGEGDGEEAFLAMELLEGETLRERVRRHGRLPLGEVLDVAAQVLDVLVAAHARGVIHRDLKPDNLFVTLGGRIKVLDFGLARLLDGIGGQQQTRTGVALGTLAYMAPEQALGRRAEIDGRVDLFALGATLFRVLSGRRVHEAESEAELLMAMASRPAPPLKAVAPEVPDAVAAVVDLALAFARDARYPDARTMLADVTALQRGGPPPFASARLASRDELTRPDGPAFAAPSPPLEPAAGGSQRTQLLPASQRTVPLAQFTEPPNPYGVTLPAPSPPLPAHPSAAPPAPSAPRRRGVIALAVALGTLLIAGAGAAVAYFALSSPAPVASASASPPPPSPPSPPLSASAPAPAGARANTTAVPTATAVRPPASPADAGTRGHFPRGRSRKPHG